MDGRPFLPILVRLNLMLLPSSIRKDGKLCLRHALNTAVHLPSPEVETVYLNYVCLELSRLVAALLAIRPPK